MIGSGAEYALYWLAVNRPDVLAEAERFPCAMLAEHRDAERRVKELLDRHARTPPAISRAAAESHHAAIRETSRAAAADRPYAPGWGVPDDEPESS